LFWRSFGSEFVFLFVLVLVLSAAVLVIDLSIILCDLLGDVERYRLDSTKPLIARVSMESL
jgi:hypothetical protein